MIEPAVEGYGGARAPGAAWRRESALLIVLAIAGAAVEYPLALAIKSLNRSEIGRALPFLGVTFVLASLVPVALRINRELGLPGAPLIAARIAGDRIHFSIRSLARVSIGYAILAAAVGAGVLVTVIVPLVLTARGGFGMLMPAPPRAVRTSGTITVTSTPAPTAAASIA